MYGPAKVTLIEFTISLQDDFRLWNYFQGECVLCNTNHSQISNFKLIFVVMMFTNWIHHKCRGTAKRVKLSNRTIYNEISAGWSKGSILERTRGLRRKKLEVPHVGDSTRISLHAPLLAPADEPLHLAGQHNIALLRKFKILHHRTRKFTDSMCHKPGVLNIQ